MFAFGDKLMQVDPLLGLPVKLVDAEGNVRFDDQNKAREWIVQVNTGTALHFYTRPIQSNDTTLVTAAYEDKLFQIDIAGARVLDTAGITLPGKIVGNPLLTETHLYIPLSDGGLVALDPTDYSEQWRVNSNQNKGMWSQPLLIDGSLFVSSMDHFLYSLDAETGEVNWSLDLGGALPSAPVYANGALYVGSLANRLFKVSTNGVKVAEYTTQGWAWGAPVVVDDMIYAADLNGFVYALRDSGGSLDEVWSKKVANGGIRMTPLVFNNTIVVGSRDHFVYWIDRESGNPLTDEQGQPLKRDMGGEVLSNLVVANADQAEPLIIVSSTDHNNLLKAYTLTGVERWKYPR